MKCLLLQAKLFSYFHHPAGYNHARAFIKVISIAALVKLLAAHYLSGFMVPAITEDRVGLVDSETAVIADRWRLFRLLKSFTIMQKMLNAHLIISTHAT